MKKEIRKQIYELIPENSKVIDIGCGNGKLLRKLSDKINYGLGIDIDKRKIDFANKNVRNNLEFKVANSIDIEGNFDISIAMFVLHSMNYEMQIKTLKKMKKISRQQIIIDYPPPKNILYKILISFDEGLAGHYKNFIKYKKNGMQKLVNNSGLKVSKEINKSFYSIWFCGK